MPMKTAGAYLCQRILFSGSVSGSTRPRWPPHKTCPTASSDSADRPSVESLVSARAATKRYVGKFFASRKDRIASRLVDLLVPVSGHERSQISTSATFMEQGFDSLSLTQVAFAIRKEFSVKVSFTQLMNQLPNIDMLAAHLDVTLPADILADEPLHAGGSSCRPLRALCLRERMFGPKASTLEEVVADQARTIARLVGLLENLRVRSRYGSSAECCKDLWFPNLPDRQFLGSLLRSASVREAKSTIPQRGIYASSRLSETLSASYNESMTVRFTGNISIEKMTRAMERLVARHDALRSSFDEAGLVMKVAPTRKIPLLVTDLSPIQESTRQQERLHKLMLPRPPYHFPCPRAVIPLPDGLLGPDRAAVILTAHHIICDGWSLDVLIHDLCAFYSEEISGEAASLQPARAMSITCGAKSTRPLGRIQGSRRLLALEIQRWFPGAGTSRRSSTERAARIQRAPSRSPGSGSSRAKPQSASGKTGLQLLRCPSQLVGYPSRPHFEAASLCHRSANCGTTSHRTARSRRTLCESPSLCCGVTRRRSRQRFLPESTGDFLRPKTMPSSR